MKGSNMHKCFPVLAVAFLSLCHISIFAQENNRYGFLYPSADFNQKRFGAVMIGEIALSSAVAVGLDFLWYKKFSHSHFHFFNDNKEWLNMDKAGHATTAYNISAVQYDLMRWSGIDNRKATLIGGLTGLGVLTIVEIFDGISQNWGFSNGDMLANLAGSGLFFAQQTIWNQQRIQLRFSYHQTFYARYNPGELGNTWAQRLFKDYNGQTYWASFNLSSFLPANNTFPRWLNADMGYGAQGMTGARTNPSCVDNRQIPQFSRYRKLYFGLGAALKSQGTTAIPYAGWINSIRIPTPVFEWDLNGSPIKFKTLFN